MNFILTTLIANLTKTDTDFPILHKHTKQAYRFKLPIRPVGVSHPTFYIDKLNFEYQACNSISVRRLPGTAKWYSFNTKIQSSCTHRKQQKYHFRFRATDFFWAMGHRYCILCIAIWGSGGGAVMDSMPLHTSAECSHFVLEAHTMSATVLVKAAWIVRTLPLQRGKHRMMYWCPKYLYKSFAAKKGNSDRVLFTDKLRSRIKDWRNHL